MSLLYSTQRASLANAVSPRGPQRFNPSLRSRCRAGIQFSCGLNGPKRSRPRLHGARSTFRPRNRCLDPGRSCGWTVDVEITWPGIAKYYRGACANSGEWDGSIRFVFARARWTIDVRLMDLGLERLIERFV